MVFYEKSACLLQEVNMPTMKSQAGFPGESGVCSRADFYFYGKSTLISTRSQYRLLQEVRSFFPGKSTEFAFSPE